MDRTERYRVDAAYRAKCIARAKALHEKKKGDKVYLRLVKIRKKIWARRNTLEIYAEKMRKLEGQLMWLLRVKARLEKERKAR